MLRIENVTKAFDDFQALKGFNLTVGKGQLVAVIGPNGAGKTTLFNVITGQLRPDSGKIVFNGENVGRLSTHQICRMGIARSFQIANIFPRLSVFRNVQVAVHARRKLSTRFFHRADRMAVEETNRILERVGLLDRKAALAGTLSHGDKRTLEIAIALGTEPQLLILDEPTAGMSPEETLTATALIQRLSAEEELTILFCEHDMEMVFAVAQSIMVMQQGHTIVQGPPEEVRLNSEVKKAYLGDY